jgi:hypothetical protein
VRDAADEISAQRTVGCGCLSGVDTILVPPSPGYCPGTKDVSLADWISPRTRVLQSRPYDAIIPQHPTERK